MVGVDKEVVEFGSLVGRSEELRPKVELSGGVFDSGDGSGKTQ